MKFSKFVKAPQTKPSSTSSGGIYKKKSSANTTTSLNTSSLIMAQQLLLTDDICRFQPQKNKLFLDENKSSSPYSVSTTTPRINFTNLVTNINGSGSGKFLKSSQPKRLQRNRLQHVTSKPESYVLRSTLNLQNNGLATTNYSTNEQAKSITSSNYNGKAFDCTDSTAHVKENVAVVETPSKTPIKSIFKKIQSVTNMATPVSMRTSPQDKGISMSVSSSSTTATSRFSFSKLTKFVSRSALKVMNRKTSTDSLGESLENSSSSDTSILNYEEENNQLNKLSHLREAAITSTTVPQSDVKPKFNKENETIINNAGGLYRQTSKNRPVMGITALMLNKHKQQMSNNQQYGLYGMTTGVMMPNMFLIGLPIIFNPANLIDDEKGIENNNNYDRLTRVNPSSQQQQQTSLKTPTPQQTPLIRTNPNQSQAYRMSVFSNRTNSPSINQPLSVNDVYDSIREAVF